MIESTKLKQAEVSQNWAVQLTVADGLLALILLGAAVLRFVNLGWLPLSENEAELAWSVWRLWQPGMENLTISSPAYFTLTSLLVNIFGFGDGVMRLVPAVFGLGVVGLPWLLRRQIGTIAALVSCGLLALSPLNVLVSRTTGGESLALFALLLLIVAVVRYQETAATHWFYLSAAAIGFGLTTTTLFYGGLVTVLGAWFILSRFDQTVNQADEETSEVSSDLRSPTSPVFNGHERRNAILMGAAVFAASGAVFLWYPAGLGATAQLLGDWLMQFGASSGRSLPDPYLAILRYEPALIILGFGGIAWAIWKNHRTALFFVYWYCLILVLMLVQVGEMSNVLLLTLPGYLLVGMLARAILNGRWTILTWLIAAGMTLIFMLLFINLARYLRVVRFNPEDTQHILVMLLAVSFTGVILYLLMTLDLTAVGQGLFLAVLAFFIFFSWGTAWWMGHEAANDPRERWVPSGTDDDVRLLLSNLKSLSRQFSNSDTGLNLASSVNTAVLRWYLRDFNNAQIGETLPLNASYDVLITPMQTELPVNDNYTGSDYEFNRLEPLPTAAVGNLAINFVETLRWWLFHDSEAKWEIEQIILWVRADLTS
ncbi:MAG: hypothetical protein GY796_24125 [Chloroflexi bacterium]|nr:hypothetical protein [Chloroflexota bacterium]